MYVVDIAVSVVSFISMCSSMSTTYIELNIEIKDTTDTAMSTTYLELNIEIKDTTYTARSTS
jgi:hypothetical protein